jgi:hypothetical protein
MDPKRIIGKNGGLQRRRGTRGHWPKKEIKKVAFLIVYWLKDGLETYF